MDGENQYAVRKRLGKSQSQRTLLMATEIIGRELDVSNSKLLRGCG